ncbi:ABC transporter permease [Solibacillus silvestris]|uniref:ABC transporter permease n=1 Tax=Solibacillus silvestris TaxID=76853 RepID=UPI003F80F6A3
MFNLNKIAIKLFRAAAAQILMSISIIMICICLIMTMGVYIWNGKTKMQEDIYALFGYADMTVGYNPEQESWLSENQVESISNIEGVKEVSPVHLTHTNVEGVLPSVYTVGVEDDDLVKSRYHFKENVKSDEVVISQKIARLFDKQVGDDLLVNFEPFTVREILTPLPGAPDVQLIILQNEVAKQYLPAHAKASQGVFTLIDLYEETYASSVTEQLVRLDDELRIDVTNEYDFVKLNFQSLMIFIVMFSFFVLVISCVLLISTFQLLFFKLKQQLMVLRSLGATKKQVGKIVQIQVLTIISIGTVFGTALSYAVIKKGLPTIVHKMQLPEVSTQFPVWLIISIALSIFIILFAIMQGQVRKTMKLLPLQITLENFNTAVKLTKRKLFIIAFAVLTSLLFLSNGFKHDDSGQGVFSILFGSLILCAVVFYVLPYGFTLLIKLCLQPVRKIFGNEAYLACQQLMPQIRKNMPIVLSVVSLMVIVIFGTTLFKSVQENEKAYHTFLYEAPVAVANDLRYPTLTNDIIQEIDRLPSVDYAFARSTYDHLELFIDEKWQGETFKAIDIEKFVEVGKLQSVVGNANNGLIVSEEYAELYHLKVGDRVRTGKFNFEAQSVVELESMQIIGLTTTGFSNLHIMIDWDSAVAKASDTLLVDDIMIETKNIDETLQEIQFLHERWPALGFSDIETFTAENNQFFYQRWSLFISVLAILIGATCIGVIQTLMYTISGKMEDYTIQRLIGLSPNGLIKLILSQVFSFISYGLCIGIFIGYIFTMLMALIDTGSHIVFDFKLLLNISAFFLILTLIVFLIQGYYISRKNLAQRLIQ